MALHDVGRRVAEAAFGKPVDNRPDIRASAWCAYPPTAKRHGYILRRWRASRIGRPRPPRLRRLLETPPAQDLKMRGDMLLAPLTRWAAKTLQFRSSAAH
jgi:hypothetical protein